MKLKDLFESSNVFKVFLSSNSSSMAISGYEKLKEEHEYKVQDGIVDEFPSSKVIDLDLQYLRKIEFVDLDEEISTNGLHFDLKQYGMFLTDLFTFVRDNYDEVILFSDELIKIKQGDNLSYLHYAIFRSCSNLLDSYNGKILRKKYENFFEILDSAKDYSFDFWNNLDRYLIVMLFIFDKLNGYAVEERNSFLNKVINNFQKINKLGVDDLYISFSKGNVDIYLSGKPEGLDEGSKFGRLDYEEENFYTDGTFTDTYNEEKQVIDVNIQNPKFVLKCGRRVGYNLFEDFNHNWSSITIYDLCFDSSKLPCEKDLQNTKSDLDSYNYMFDIKKLSILKKKLKQMEKLLSALYLNLDSVVELSEELDIFELLKDKVDLDSVRLFSDEDMVVLGVSQISQIDEIFDEMGKRLVKRR